MNSFLFLPPVCKEAACLAQTFRPLGMGPFLENWSSVVSTEQVMDG